MKLFDGNLLRMELGRGFKGVLIWTLSISAAMVLVICLYPMVIEMYAAIPPEFAAMMETFGGIPDSIVEYYATEGAMMLQLFGAVFAALQGFGAVNRDERERTAESLYVLPLARRTFFMTKLLRVTLEVLAFAAVCGITSYLGFLIVDEPIDFIPFFLFSVLDAVVLVMFAWLAFVTACLMKPNAKPMSAIALPFSLYVLFVVAMATDNEIIDLVKYLTPFTFADPVELLKSDFKFEWISFTIFSALCLGGAFYALKRFEKREITL